MTRSHLTAICLATSLAAAAQSGGQTLTIRNNHDLPYTGPVEIRAGIPDGRYAGSAHERSAAADVINGVITARVDQPGRSEITLARLAGTSDPDRSDSFSIVASGNGAQLLWRGQVVGRVEYALTVRDTTATTDDAVRDFSALPLAWVKQGNGRWTATTESQGFSVVISFSPAIAGAAGFEARVSRIAGSDPAPRAYVALTRRVETPGAGAPALRFNGRRFDTADSPEIWDRDFWYTHGVDWFSWPAGALHFLAVNGFTPVPPVARGGGWREGSHFWVWEKTRRTGDSHFLVSEIAGPNPSQASITQYSPLIRGDTVVLSWRLAVTDNRPASWEESQLAGYAGPKFVTTGANGATIDLGVKHVSFGVSYFPYSTLTENFDYYRTPGLSKEGFWAFSPVLWARWRELQPRMRTDLHIIRAMGFEKVRLHHLELLQKMDRHEAIAFLDFFVSEARALKLPILVDSEGPAEWLMLLARRYGNAIVGYELENEVLISGITAAGPARWKSLYAALKSISPQTDVFLTGVGNNGMYERLRSLGVPFDRVGLHAYKHGPQWKESFASHALGTASYASGLGMPVTLGEFNWKELTKLAPPARLEHYTEVYERVLGTRSIPDVFHFQFQESLSFNPAVAGTFTRHYETLRVDRRPKPEAFELMRLIRKYAAPEAPVNQLRVTVSPARILGATATAEFSVTNTSPRILRVSLAPRAFDGVSSRLLSSRSMTLSPGRTGRGRISLRTKPGALPGIYHHFVVADYGTAKTIGWGTASLEGAPTFSPPVLPDDRVDYSEGAASVTRLDWKKPLAVVFGTDATVLELETAYTLTNTLQSATGKDVWLSSETDLPDSIAAHAVVMVVGTPASTAMARERQISLPANRGLVVVARDRGRERVFMTGVEKTHAQAAALDVILRFWKNAKDSMIRLTGMERGAALGNRIPGVVVDPP